MENIKLVEVLKTFDRKEFKRFGEFVSSLFYNKNKPVINLYKSLSRFYPEFKSKNFITENVFMEIFPKEKFDYHKINNVISDLYKLSEKFLACIGNEKREYSEQRSMLPEFRLRKLYKIYEQKFAAYMKQLIERPVKDEDYFYYMYEMNDDYMYYTTKKKPNRDMNMLQNEFDNFFSFSMIRLLKFYCLMLHEKIGQNVEYELTMFDEIISYMRNHKIDNNPTLQIFGNITLLLQTKENKYYEELKMLKEKYFNELKRADQYLLFMHLYDHCGYVVNYKEDESYFRDMFEILREWVEKKFMTVEDFHYQELMNIVKIACSVKELEYAEKILKEYHHHIPKEFKDNVYHYCMGQIEYAKGNFKTALEFFSKSSFQNFIYKVQVKITVLKIYYTLERYEEAFGMIDTFRHFVSREENLPAEHRESYNLFLKLISDLIKLKENPDKKDAGFKLKKIKVETKTMPANPFGIKVWLMERC